MSTHVDRSRGTGALKRGHERARRGFPARYPLAQFPNAPLLIALAARLVAAVADGAARHYAMAVFYVGLSVWAWLELSDGVNSARRVLGAAGLVYAVVQVGQAFGA
jgi:hypothetical protein